MKTTNDISRVLENRLQMIPSSYDRRKMRGIIQRIRTADKKALSKTMREETALLAYLECLAVECGEGECARAIRTKFNLEVHKD